MQVLAKDKSQKTRRSLQKKVFKKDLGIYVTVNLYESKNLETQVIFIIVDEPELYFLLKIQIRKIRITLHSFIRDGCIWQKNITYKCLLSQPVSIPSGFKCYQ